MLVNCPRRENLCVQTDRECVRRTKSLSLTSPKTTLFFLSINYLRNSKNQTQRGRCGREIIYYTVNSMTSHSCMHSLCCSAWSAFYCSFFLKYLMEKELFCRGLIHFRLIYPSSSSCSSLILVN